MGQISNEVAVRDGGATSIAATTTVNGTIIDMQGFEGCLFAAKFGTPATDNTLKVQQGAAANMSDAADLEDTQVDPGASDERVWVDIYRPRERYLRAVALRGTSTTLDDIIAIPYGARSQPVDNNTAGTIAGKMRVSPAEGTA